MSSFQQFSTRNADVALSRVTPEQAGQSATASQKKRNRSSRKVKTDDRARGSKRRSHDIEKSRNNNNNNGVGTDVSSSGYSGSFSSSSSRTQHPQRLLDEDGHRTTERLDSFGNVAYEAFFLGNQLLFNTQPDSSGGGTGFSVPPMIDVPWELRRETSAASELCRLFAFLGTRHFWWLIQYAARVTFIAMLVPCALIYADLPHTPFISISYALASVVIAVGTTVGMSMLFFLQYFKAGCIWLPITTICVALRLDEHLAAWFVVYVVLLFLMAMFTEKTTRRMCLLLFNIPMVALLGGSHDLIYPSRVLADWFLGAAFALLATLIPYPMLATRASRDISSSLFRNTATCFTGILDCFWAPSNTERSMSMVRIRYLVRTIDQLIDKFDAFDAFTFYEVLFFESYEYRQVRKEKVRLLFQLKMNLRTMERVINMVQEKPQMLDQTERCLLLRSHVSRPMDAISRSTETLLYHISEAKTYEALRALTSYYELVGRSVKYLQDEFDIARRVLFYESGHYGNHDNRYTRSGTAAAHRETGDGADDNDKEYSHVGLHHKSTRSKSRGDNSRGAADASGLPRYNTATTNNSSHHGQHHHHNHHNHHGAVDGTSAPCLISMDTTVERMEEYVPLMTFFVFSIANFWGTLRDYEQQMDCVRERPGFRETVCFVWRGILDPFYDNARLVKNLFTNPTEPDVRIVIEAAKVSIAMLISVIFFYYIDDHSLLLSGPTIIAFVSGTNPVEAVQASAARLTGTLMGSVLGFFAATLCTTAVDRVASICIITFVMSFFRPEQKFGSICMYCNFVAISAITDKSADSNLSRIQQNTFAIFIYCFISVSFFPVSPNKVLFEKRLAVVRGLANTVTRLMGLLREASISYEETQIRAQWGTRAEVGMAVDGKSFFPRRGSALTTMHSPGDTSPTLNNNSSSSKFNNNHTNATVPTATGMNGSNLMNRRNSCAAHGQGHTAAGGGAAAPAHLFEPLSPAANAMFPPPAMTNASTTLPMMNMLDPPAAVDRDEADEPCSFGNQGFRGLGALPGSADDLGGTAAVPVLNRVNSRLVGKKNASRVAIESENANRTGEAASGLLPHAFTMAPEDPTIDSIFVSIFSMLDTMKTTTSIMPLAADEFNVVPKEYPLRASGEVHAALYRMCALVYTMASCWKVMRDKGYFTTDMVHIFHNLAPLAMDISSCLERFAHVLTYYVHSPSAALSSELTKGVMQLRALCVELSVRKERDLLAVIRQTIIEQQVWRPRRARDAKRRRSSSSSSSSSSRRLVSTPGIDVTEHGGGVDELQPDTYAPRVARPRSSIICDGAEPQLSNETRVFDLALLGTHDEARAVATAAAATAAAVGAGAHDQRTITPTEQPWARRGDGVEQEERLIRSISTASASMATFSQHPSPGSASMEVAAPPLMQNAIKEDMASSSHHHHHHRHEQPQPQQAHQNRHSKSCDDVSLERDRHGKQRQHRQQQHQKQPRAHTNSPQNSRGVPHATSSVSLADGSPRGMRQSWSSSGVADLSAAGDDPHRDGAERLREEVRRARQLARYETGGSSSGLHRHPHTGSDHHTQHPHRHHKHRHARGDSQATHSPFETSLASAPYGSLEGDIDTIPAAPVVKGKPRKGGRHAEHPRASSRYTLASSSSASSRSTSSASSRASSSSNSAAWSAPSRSDSSISLVQFNESFTTPITVYDAEGLHGFTLALEMLAKELRRALFGFEEMLQNQV